LKIEEISTNPPIWQIYDLLGEKFIEKIIATGKPLLKRAKVTGTPEKRNQPSDVRTSSVAWVPDSLDRAHWLIKVPRLVEQITGLSLLTEFKAAEELQLSCYGVCLRI